jgi:hypothetical protein
MADKEPCKAAKVLMTQTRSRLLALIGALFVVGACNGDIDFSHSRAISADIAAALGEGSTARSHATTTRSEPAGTIPWQMRD